MPYRFTDTEKWKDDWYLSLSNEDRMVYQWLSDNCNHAGIIKKEFTMMNFCCRTNYGTKELLDVFKGKILDCGNFLFLTSYLKNQYPKGLKSDKPSVKSTRLLLLKASENVTIKEWLDNHYPMITKSLCNQSHLIKDKDKDRKGECEGENKKAAYNPFPTAEEHQRVMAKS